MKRALISVSDKTGIVEFAQELIRLDYELISTGGTFDTLINSGVKVKKVSEITEFPEILDGRVKTLHPKIHGGILALREEKHIEQIREFGIEFIDMVVVNLYPFAATIARPGVSMAEAIENIDIGGPSMIRSAAKNFQNVVVVVNPDSYEDIIAGLKNNNDLSYDKRLQLAQKAFSHTAAYDAMISSYLSQKAGEIFPEHVFICGRKVYELRYGENPHQNAGFYKSDSAKAGLSQAEQLNGKELSYNNIFDGEAAWNLVQEFSEPCCVIIKHTNPCGTAVADNLSLAFDKAWSCDPVSAYGGVIAFNEKIDLATAQKLKEPFLEIVLAPDFDSEALEVLKSKKNLRLLKMEKEQQISRDFRSINGGLLIQDADIVSEDENSWQQVTIEQAELSMMNDLRLAWKVVKHVKSNAIAIVKDGMTIGIGAGQMNRVGAAKIALEQAREKAYDAVLASDAFFPFADTVELAGQYGIKAIIQPGGSVRDQESIEACDRLGIAMIFTGVRHFKH